MYVSEAVATLLTCRSTEIALWMVYGERRSGLMTNMLLGMFELPVPANEPGSQRSGPGEQVVQERLVGGGGSIDRELLLNDSVLAVCSEGPGPGRSGHKKCRSQS